MYCALTKDKPRAEIISRHGVYLLTHPMILMINRNNRLHFID